MSTIEWQPAYDVQVSRFDEQHKKLFQLMSDLHNAMKEGEGQIKLAEIFNALTAYTTTHFSDEISLMESMNYPGTAEHKAQHDNLIMQVGELNKKFVKGDGVVSIEVLNFLKNWLVTHIQHEDKKYGLFFNSKGIY